MTYHTTYTNAIFYFALLPFHVASEAKTND